MPKKRTTGDAGQHSFTNWAIAIVAILIGVMSVAIVALLAVMAMGGPDLKTLAQPETRQSTATPQPRPTILVWETPTPPMGFRPSFPTDVPATSLPTQPAQAAVDNIMSDTAVSSGTSATNYIHPTYQPTTEPCSSCHEEIRPGQ